MNTIYTIGYGGCPPTQVHEEIARILDEKGAILVDTRFSPYAYTPLFHGRTLKIRYMGHYTHVKEVGNSNYKGGEISLVDEEAGLSILEILLKASPLLLLCGCGKPDQCHRGYIARKLHERTGAPVKHITFSKLVLYDK